MNAKSLSRVAAASAVCFVVVLFFLPLSLHFSQGDRDLHGSIGVLICPQHGSHLLKLKQQGQGRTERLVQKTGQDKPETHDEGGTNKEGQEEMGKVG